MGFYDIIYKNTKAMTESEFVDYIQNQLIPACNEQWGAGGYLIMMCDSPDLVIAPVCEDCGLPVPNERYYITLSQEAVENDIDLEDTILIDGYDDNDFGFTLSRKIEDCDCKDYDDDEDEDEDGDE